MEHALQMYSTIHLKSKDWQKSINYGIPGSKAINKMVKSERQGGARMAA